MNRRRRLLRPVRTALRCIGALVASIPGTTLGEVAEIAGSGPCGRCIGRMVIDNVMEVQMTEAGATEAMGIATTGLM